MELSQSRNSAFMEPEVITVSQEHAIGPCRKRDKSSPHYPALFNTGVTKTTNS